MSTNCFRESTFKRHRILYENCIEDMKIPTLLLAYSVPYTLVKSIGLYFVTYRQLQNVCYHQLIGKEIKL